MSQPDHMDHAPKRDPHTGHMTTGHEWNGITELNTPVPKPVWFFLTIAFLFGVGYWILMPAWPLGHTYTKGLLGVDQRRTVEHKLQQAAAHAPEWMAKVAAADYATIQADPALMADVRQRGHTLFGDNCAVCHGLNATGNKGFPNLTDNDWLWGGDPDTVFETIRVGINSTHPDSRVSQMPAFGHDQMLPRADILTVIAYVRSLSGPVDKEDQAKVAAGKDLFAANCAACHGEDAKGQTAMGTPNLSDAIWLYGGDKETVFETVYNGRQGHMPSWEARLTALDRKVLTLYVLDLGRKGAPADSAAVKASEGTVP
ncbi:MULTISPECIES: cytochrome-c oxidase, cbb3-type subunit III [Nitrospirillum]|uniref:Cbb3-type cytochrome c oxidase subunit n=1 Tax=Nitrospirillum amazonense TaxID=28077 RepID=A0A560FTN4_9PROT|nr:cytochrome-c oxidase, cbb3-type subunit III [Nitrospirillum amazonense]MEC4590143.1 cytochrome-c oxidase, cbb3-type subunit III [Nitrospirillum amazonense]TWB24978.1 cytochrome c oxidase cbb3-type subunit 3 [Nitrospirillum amazonense]